MLELVFDTSALQACWRSGLLHPVADRFVLLVPRAVADETRHFIVFETGKTKARRLLLAPDLDDCSHIRSVDVARDEVDRAMLRFFGRPHAAVLHYEGVAYAWSGRAQRQIGVAELEVVALAALRNAIAVIDDHKGLLAACDNAVLTATSRELLDELRSLGVDCAGALERIEQTGYIPTLERSKRPAFRRAS